MLSSPSVFLAMRGENGFATIERQIHSHPCREIYCSIIQGVHRSTWILTPPFSRTYVDAAGCPFRCWTGIVADLIFWKKNLKFFILSGSGPGTSSAWFSGSAWFAASSSSSSPRVFSFLAWKSLHMVNVTSKMNFLVRFTMWSGFQAKMLITRGELELQLAANRAEPENQAWLYLALTLSQKKFPIFFFKKSNPQLCPFTT